MKKVYRLEANEKGIYCSDNFACLPDKLVDLINSMADKHNASNFHTHLFDDFSSKQQDRIFFEALLFACDSLESLKEWFKGYLEELLRWEQVKIYEYETEDYIISRSGRQLVFKPEYDLLWREKKIKIEVK